MSGTTKTTLCILFNHPHLKNIPILEEIYASKFDRMYFVVPNTLDPRPNVITAYRGSYNFHGMVVDAAPRLLADDSTHFFFVQDDVLLNPRFSGSDFVDRLKLDAGAFMPKPAPVGGDIFDWPWLLGFAWKTRQPRDTIAGTGIENWQSLLPDADQCIAKIEGKYGFKFEPLKIGSIAGNEVMGARQKLNQALLDILFRNPKFRDSGIPSEFPYCRGIADFFATNRTTLENLVHPLGVLAAMQVFVEIALPTALLLAADRVMFEQDVDCTLKWNWNGDQSGLDFDTISKGFEEDLIAVHPIKLAKDEEMVRTIIAHFASSEQASAA